MRSFTSGGSRLLIAGFLLVGCVVVFLLIQAFHSPERESSEAPPRDRQLDRTPVSRSSANGADGTGGLEPYAGSVRVATILGDSLLDDRTVRNRLLEIAEETSALTEEREEALSHALILTPDEDIDVLAGAVSEGEWGNELLQVFLDDFMNRPDPGRLVLLVEVMDVAKPPIRNEVRESLEFLLDQDLADDIEAWREAAKSWSDDISR